MYFPLAFDQRALPVIFLLACYIAGAQTDTLVFKDMKKIEIHDYVLPIPQKWKVIGMTDPNTEEKKYDFTGVGLPETVNSDPLTALFTMRKYVCDSLRAAEEFSLSEMISYPDRITPKGYNYEKDTLRVSSGERATLFTTHYYRQTKHFNFTAYELVVYSKKRKAAYIINILYKYHDSTYAIEKNLRLKEYALRIFKGLVLR